MSKHSDNLDGKNNILHEHYKLNWGYYKEFIDLIDTIIKSYSSFADSLNNIITNKKKNINFFEKKPNLFYDLMQCLKYHIKLESQEYKDLSNHIIRDIIEPFKNIKSNNDKSEVEMFKNYNEFLKKFKTEKSKVEENKNNYYTKMKEAEKLIVEEKSMKVDLFSSNQEIKDKKKLAFETTCEGQIFEENYQKSIENFNKIVEEKNAKEKELVNFYQEKEKQRLNSIKENFFYLITNIKTSNCKINCDVDDISSKYIGLKLENRINKYIENANLFSEKNIEFEPYTPFSSLENSLENSTQNEEMNLNYEVIFYLQKFCPKICQNIDMEEEKKRKRFRLLCLNLFEQNEQNFSKEDLNELIDLIKIKEYRSYFLSTLTNQRLNGKFKREEKLFNELIYILNAILEMAEKEKNFDNARNCIILSQTFYKENIVDGEIEKYYLMEDLKKNKWISTPTFWKELIEYLIMKDEEENPGNSSKLLFSKLLTHSHNMNMFGISKNDNLDIINYFINKYKISEKSKEIIFNNLEDLYSEKKEIKKVVKKPKNIEGINNGNENNKDIKNKKGNISKEDIKNDDLKKIEDEWVIENYDFNDYKKDDNKNKGKNKDENEEDEEEENEDNYNQINENEIKNEIKENIIKTDEDILNEGTLKINEILNK